jgi:putative RecB family exonuclease
MEAIVADPDSNASTIPFAFALSGRDEPPPYYSYSHLARYAQCPLSFRLHYLDRLPADAGPERDFGAVVHRALEVAVRAHVEARRTGALDAKLAAEAFREAWAASDLRDHALFVEGLDLVARWVAREGAVDGARVLGIELPFTLHFGGVALRGVMDRVDRVGDDAVRVRDYKSTRLPPRREDADDSLQLAIYDLAARQLWPWVRRVELSLDLLRHDVAVTVERTAAQREATRQYVLASVAQIRGGEMPARPGAACAHCDHRSQCPAWAPT